ncbi:MAG: L,D-transpeptidase family protein [Bradyrhizobium sp.]
MMINRLLTICAAVTVGAVAMPFARAQQTYPVPSGPIYSSTESSYPTAYGPVGDRAVTQGAPDFDAVANGQTSASQRSPTGPILSPDDPRYGRPAGPPPIIYANTPAGASPRPYAYGPGADRNAPRPPEAVGSPADVTGSVREPQGADGRPMTLASLPPDEQPEAMADAKLPPKLRRREVSFLTKEPPGTIVVDTAHTYLYYILGHGRAIRYGVRVGRDGFRWSGVEKITRKKEWPDWYPPSEMIKRQPYLPRFMAGGPGNPLGARAMYLGHTDYRIHGTNEPSTIGHYVSSGCIGMLNADVEDLYSRAKVGTRVVVLPGGPPAGTDTAAYDDPSPGYYAAAPRSSASARTGIQASNAPPPGTAPTVVPPLPPPVAIR